MNTIKIRTAQNVEVEYAMASVGDRVVAHLIDMVVYFVWAMFMFMMAVAADVNERYLTAIVIGGPFVFYHLLCEIFFNGQSVGKKARDLKVIKLSGEAPGIGDYLLRWMFRLIDTMGSNGLVALVAVAASSKGQRLGDMAAGTCVIKTQAVRPQKLFDVTIEGNYQIRFPEVSALTDQDMTLVKKLLAKAQEHKNYSLLETIAIRVKETTGSQTELSDWEFLTTVIKDYHHYTHAEVAVS
ncbi:RDD family protein [Pontibacter beigongshangensis]|uniref:RDD family protein n=1 Tax=Pontibacter beigongshangensis TaxID=2574733 RepID=UPI001650C619|nr:RDD family protein [Pontibacter beigongshangensis]